MTLTCPECHAAPLDCCADGLRESGAVTVEYECESVYRYELGKAGQEAEWHSERCGDRVAASEKEAFDDNTMRSMKEDRE